MQIDRITGRRCIRGRSEIAIGSGGIGNDRFARTTDILVATSILAVDNLSRDWACSKQRERRKFEKLH